jgi:signal peptidase I
MIEPQDTVDHTDKARTDAVVSLTAITALVLVPRIAGATPYTILAGSMMPDIPPGTIIAVKPTPFDQIRQGDVISYQIESASRWCSAPTCR